MSSRRERENKLFVVSFRDTDYLPAFQIESGEPVPAIEAVLRTFAGKSP